MDTLEAQEKLEKARARVQSRYPFYGPVLFRIKLILRPLIPTFSLDQWWRLYFNPNYVGEKTVRELSGVLAQTVEQILRGHGARRGHRNPFIWAIACLLESGSSLVDDSMLGLPTESVYPGFYNFKSGLTAEEYYRLLSKMDKIPIPWTPLDAEGNPVDEPFQMIWGTERMPLVPGSELTGESEDWELPDPGFEEFRIDPLLMSGIESEVHREVRKLRSDKPGDVPDYLLRQALLIAGRINWQGKLLDRIGLAQYWGSGAITFNYLAPSLLQSVVPDGIILPSFECSSPRVLIIVDTSGSMEEEHLSLAVGEVDGVIRTVCAADGIRVIPTDSRAKAVQQIYSVSQLELVGGGGTDMGAGLLQANKVSPRPDAVIVITDGYTGWPSSRLADMEVIVLNVSRKWPRSGKKEYPAPSWATLIEMFPVSLREAA